ncbi:MAG: hypothetical protein RM049_16140 [Nostoc sp. DedQUE04]|uniref:hypothetical protein n=1 Tax=Nostoc sp. DedQUE04 TaxID=3075390 RepID=UPI002AD20F00|nr:hypothetical protein [Nostoc sp. DedQUE04]MDZ8136815.1 hypothetical protein [Nostoc sp. DedQUE04]
MRSDVYDGLFGVALQKTSKIKRSPVLEKLVRSLCRKPQKQSDHLLWKSKLSPCRKPQK